MTQSHHKLGVFPGRPAVSPFLFRRMGVLPLVSEKHAQYSPVQLTDCRLPYFLWQKCWSVSCTAVEMLLFTSEFILLLPKSHHERCVSQSHKQPCMFHRAGHLPWIRHSSFFSHHFSSSIALVELPLNHLKLGPFLVNYNLLFLLLKLTNVCLVLNPLRPFIFLQCFLTHLCLHPEECSTSVRCKCHIWNRLCSFC